MLILKDHLCSTSILEKIYVYSGTIELAEMIDIIGTLYEMDGISKVDSRDFKYYIFNGVTGFQSALSRLLFKFALSGYYAGITSTTLNCTEHAMIVLTTNLNTHIFCHDDNVTIFTLWYDLNTI